jgi:hypothetical protein
VLPSVALNRVAPVQNAKCQVDGSDSANSCIITGLKTFRGVLIEFSSSVFCEACPSIEHSSHLKSNQNKTGGIQEKRRFSY